MSSNRLPAALIIGLVLVFIVRVAMVWEQLPDPMASHFDGAGQPNGWMSRTSFLVVYVGMLQLEVGFAVFLPLLLRRMPPETVNLPNRDYWMTPERREGTLAKLAAKTSWFFLAITALLVLVGFLALDANLESEPRLSDAVPIMLVVFAVFVIVWVIDFYRSFRVDSGLTGPPSI